MIFNPDRYGFCVIGDRLVLMDSDKRHMRTQVWMEDILRLSKDDIDVAIRGYIMPNRIQFFTSPHYNTCMEVNEDIIADAVAMYAALYETSAVTAISVPVYNGVHPGAEGDTWPPVLMWDYDTGRWVIAA